MSDSSCIASSLARTPSGDLSAGAGAGRGEGLAGRAAPAPARQRQTPPSENRSEPDHPHPCWQGKQRQGECAPSQRPPRRDPALATRESPVRGQGGPHRRHQGSTAGQRWQPERRRWPAQPHPSPAAPPPARPCLRAWEPPSLRTQPRQPCRYSGLSANAPRAPSRRASGNVCSSPNIASGRPAPVTLPKRARPGAPRALEATEECPFALPLKATLPPASPRFCASWPRPAWASSWFPSRSPSGKGFPPTTMSKCQSARRRMLG